MNAVIDTMRIICRLSDLQDPGARGFALGGGDWPLRGFVVRRGDQVSAFVNRCPHQGHPLNWQPDRFLSPDGSVILCSSHGALFDTTDGACIAGPCAGRSLERLQLRIEAGLVILGDDVPLEERSQRD
jgi:nitrite reductase/ring-hydroxylating ferredoxin subunit